MGDSISDIKSTENIPPNSCTTEGDVLSMKITNDFQELFSKVQSLRNLIFGLKEENIVSTAESIMNIGEINYPFSYGLVLSQLIYSAFISQKKDFNIYLQLMLEIGEKEEACEHKLIDIFKFFIFSFFPKHAECQETNYILEQLIEHNYLNPKDLPIGSLYFIQYQANKVSLFDNFSPFKNYFLHNINKLKKDNWALHKKYVKEGINPNEIAKAIRYDNVENLQELASQTNFDFNQTIEPSLYERFSYINQRDVSLIDYAAFFGSIKCFKFLMLNGSDLNNIVLNDNFPTDNLSSTCLYAIAGGNNQIIHFCEESHIPFNGSLEIAIKFHQNDIFYYIYENKLTEINDLSLLGKECIKYYNLEIFLFLLKEGMKLSTSIIEDVAKIGNIFIIKSLIEENQIPKTILIYSSISGNIELVKLILEQKGIDINEKKDGKTALICASYTGNTEIVKLLLEQEGIDINVKDNLGKTAFMFASEYGHTEIVKLLLKQGIDINDRDNGEWTALMKASLNGHTEIVKILIEIEGIDVNTKEGEKEKQIVFELAAERGFTEIAKMLFELKGIDVNGKNYIYYDKFVFQNNIRNLIISFDTILIRASANGRYEIVKLLLEQEGIDINGKNEIHYNNFLFQINISKFFILFETALIRSCLRGQLEIIKLLLEQEGIDFNAKDKFISK